LLHLTAVDPKPLEVSDSSWAEEISAYTRDHPDLRSTPSRRHRLVRTLASKSEVELFPKNGLASFGEPFRKRNQIDIGAADYGNPRRLGHEYVNLWEEGRV
jgi:hypothetical protein